MSSFFELVTKVLIVFFVFSCLLDLLSLYCSMTSFENKALVTSIISSLMHSIKSQSLASLCSFLLTFITSRTHLPLRFSESFESSMKIASDLSRGFHWLDCVILSHLIKKLRNFWKLSASSFLTCGQALISFLYIVIILYVYYRTSSNHTNHFFCISFSVSDWTSKLSSGAVNPLIYNFMKQSHEIMVF